MGKPQRVDLSNVVSLSDVSKQPVGDHETGVDDAIVMPGDDHGDWVGDHETGVDDAIASLGDDAVLTFRQIGELLDEKPNTVCTSYWKKIAQAHEGLESPRLRMGDGSPTGYFAKSLAEYLKLNKDYDAYRAALVARFPAIAQAPITPTVAIARYEPGEAVALARQSLERVEDRKFQVLSDVAETIQQYKAHSQQLGQSKVQQVYEQEFTAELKRLQEEMQLKMVQDKAREDARKFLQQQMEGGGD